MPHLVTAFAVITALQGNAARVLPVPRGAGAATMAVAAPASRPPVIDGRDDDPVWRGAAVIDGFRQALPVANGDPRFATTARVAYDAHNLYVFVRAFDPHPDSIVRAVARRDQAVATDHITVTVDAYHDRRTGFEFSVTPAGEQLDAAIYDDNQTDDAWDGVWQVATRVDSAGWTAEFRIPLSQLRYPHEPANVFGFGVSRWVQRFSEEDDWPVIDYSRSALASQLGELTGLSGLADPRRLEVTPYSVAKNTGVPAGSGFDRDQQFTGGADFRYGVTSNLTMDGTINPDFGQVEADPSVLNLTAFETFFQERRPFFESGAGIFYVPVNCNVVNCSNEQLFYSRRIGRAPELAPAYGATAPAATTILGAAKLTGRLAGGLRLGAMDAVTQTERDDSGHTVEPGTNYAALRLQQDLGGGESDVGLMMTAVNRSLDRWTDTTLRRSAYVGAFDFRHRFAGGRYQLSGSLDLSRVAGSAAAIAATQRDAVHNYERPDAGLPYDTTRTVLRGDAEEILFGKYAGEHTEFETSYQRRSAGFEINDLGYLQQADRQSWSTWGTLRFLKPTALYRRAFWNFNWWQWWTTRGLAVERAANTNLHVQTHSNWYLNGGVTWGQLGATYCDACARGGPAVRQDPYVNVWTDVTADDRRAAYPELALQYFHGDAGRSRMLELDPRLTFRVAARVQGQVGASLMANRNDIQWFGNFTDSTGARHYTFAHLDQQTASLTARIDYTFTNTLTLQLYAQPFVSRGTYRDVRELAAPRAGAFDARYTAYGDTAVANHPGGFNVKQFNSTVVLRWEYRPGSTVFVVWTQGRAGVAPVEGDRPLGGDLARVFDLHPLNTFLVKLSYWFDW